MTGDYFFPSHNLDETVAGTQLVVRRICASCPVLYLCREYAMDDPELLGIWGGWTVQKRTRERNKRAKIERERREGSTSPSDEDQHGETSDADAGGEGCEEVG